MTLAHCMAGAPFGGAPQERCSMCTLFSPGSERKMIRQELSLGPRPPRDSILLWGPRSLQPAPCCPQARPLSAEALCTIAGGPPYGTGSPRPARCAPKDPEFVGVCCVIKGALKIRGFFVLVYHAHRPMGDWSGSASRWVGWGVFSWFHEASASLTCSYSSPGQGQKSKRRGRKHTMPAPLPRSLDVARGQSQHQRGPTPAAQAHDDGSSAGRV